MNRCSKYSLAQNNRQSSSVVKLFVINHYIITNQAAAWGFYGEKKKLQENDMATLKPSKNPHITMESPI
jgi:hypothetical protein